ncbi:MAG: nucleotidyltransferase family protein [Chloroflexota bacterium]
MTWELGEITAVVLAGGLGTRLRPVITNRPKCLAEVNGKPFLTFLLNQIAFTGIKHVVLCIGHLGEQVKATFGTNYRTLSLEYSQETELLGTGGALRLAVPLLKSGTVLALNGDSYCDLNLEDFWYWHNQQHTPVSLALAMVENVSRYGQVRTNDDGRVTEFVEKGQAQGAGWINAGIYLLGYSMITSIPDGQVISLEKDIFPNWIQKGLSGYRSPGRLLDIGTPESYAQAELFFAEEIA